MSWKLRELLSTGANDWSKQAEHPHWINNNRRGHGFVFSPRRSINGDCVQRSHGGFAYRCLSTTI